jgi:hypothetical protein
LNNGTSKLFIRCVAVYVKGFIVIEILQEAILRQYSFDLLKRSLAFMSRDTESRYCDNGFPRPKSGDVVIRHFTNDQTCQDSVLNSTQYTCYIEEDRFQYMKGRVHLL